METKLKLITEMAKEDRKCKFKNLIHLLNVSNLKECFYMLKRGKAPGIDKVSVEDYEKNLQANLENLVVRMKRMSYRPQPVRRTYIPKGDGSKVRPLGIPAVEDKIIQMAMTRILEAIYEVDFKEFSYGFRKGRNQHQALKVVDNTIMNCPVTYVIDADIKGFFDNVDHKWMVRCLEERISDSTFMRYIVRILKSGVMEEGNFYAVEVGTPQGGIISPILANVYLHYVLDLWVEKKIKKTCKGFVSMVRYADDFVIFTEHKEEAYFIMDELQKRLGKFGLELSKEKTKIIRFTIRWKDNDDDDEGNGTFNFLAFTHYIGKSKRGNPKVARKTAKARFARAVHKVKLYMSINRSKHKLKELWKGIRTRLLGHYRYFGVSDNLRHLTRFLDAVESIVFKWLNRRSQKKSFTWEQFCKYQKAYPLPKPRIYHSMYF